ncbi:MAG TPA: glycosyltransferase family 4 protein, partial [Terriglobales bacterium]|nr:glycosyltransferase family 4 protein [Terriglobales bacterium]
VGQVSDVRPYYRMADVVAISSVSEGSPNVLLEAMAAGVPVVATSVGGIPEMVAGRDAVLLVEPANPDAMAAAIARLLADSESAHRMAANALQLVATQYSPQNRARWLLDLYASVGRRGPGAEVNSVLEPVAGETKGE